MKEIESLVEKARKYLRGVKIFLKEDYYESSVSRTYYAMFYCAQAMLLTKNLSFFCKNRYLPKRDWKRDK